MSERQSSSITCAMLFAAGCLSLQGGCVPWGVTTGANVVKQCTLPAEQTYTLQGKWESVPVRISFQSGAWSTSEISSIQAGIEKWNSFFSASKGFKVFDAGPAGTGYTSASTGASGPSYGSGTIPDGVVLYKRYQSWSYGAGTVALTSTSYNHGVGGQLPVIFNAIMEFNYVNFFAPGSNQFPDLQSIAIHELGHLLGLDHSCGPLGEPNTGRTYTACPDFNRYPSHYMVQAVMYPKVPMSTSASGAKYGQVKTGLTSNDQGRANCLY